MVAWCGDRPKQRIGKDERKPTLNDIFLKMAWVKCCSCGTITTLNDNYLSLAWQVEGPPVSFGQEYTRNYHAKKQNNVFSVVFSVSCSSRLRRRTHWLLPKVLSQPKGCSAPLGCCVLHATVRRRGQGQAERLPRKRACSLTPPEHSGTKRHKKITGPDGTCYYSGCRGGT